MLICGLCSAMEISSQAFDIICRACLSESHNMKSLYTKLKDASGQLLDLLKFAANIEINSSDALPKQICDSCEAFLYKSDEFKRRCKESEVILKNVCPNAYEPYSVKTDNNKSENDAKIQHVSPEKSINYEGDLEKPDFMSLFANSDICFKKLDTSSLEHKHTAKSEFGLEIGNGDYSDGFDDREDLKMPVEFDQKHEIKSYKCDCGEEYKSKFNLKKHIKNKNCIVKKRRKNSSKTPLPIKNELACPKCDQIFESINSWSTHQLSHISPRRKVLKNQEDHVPKVQCSLCLQKFKNKKTLTKHIVRHETKDNVKYICTKCKREFKYKAFLESHMLSVHAKGMLQYFFVYS